MVESLVETMVLLARHGKKLPRPQRVLRENTSVEARLNATNAALQPHAGGFIKKWSDAVEGEIRDDQGISLHNPDTDVFMDYHLAGAYDSNIALLLTVGNDRLETYQKMAEILRVTQLRGVNLCTNLEFHYGLVHWFISQNINARPTTGFVVPYLTAVGQLKEKADSLDVGYTYGKIKQALVDNCQDKTDAAAMKEILDFKATLLQRPVNALFDRPHVFSGWLSAYRQYFKVDAGRVHWLENPFKLLDRTYKFLNMEFVESRPALYQVWSNDNTILKDGLEFYRSLEERTGVSDWPELQSILEGKKAPAKVKHSWSKVQAAHRGYQAGIELLALLPYVADHTKFFDLYANPDLTITIPKGLTDKDLQARMTKVLAPPPIAKSDEIVATSGGMFYSREAPGMDVFVKPGDHFEQGDPLYIVEVMKMFNKVYAPFAGRIETALIEGDGLIIKKGQTLFKVVPDEEIVIESEEDRLARRAAATDKFLSCMG